VFDRIAPGWYNVRHWSIFRTELEDLSRRWRSGRLLNLGCAHGPDFLPFAPDFDLCGVDFSGEMLRLGRKYAAKFGFSAGLVRADVTALPFAAASFDCAISVATYHHLNPAGALTALGELRRVLRPGGEALVTVWNRWQTRFWFSGKEVAVPWRAGGETLHRYYYLFTYPELQGLAEKAGLLVVKSFPEHSYRLPMKQFSRNVCLLVRRP